MESNHMKKILCILCGLLMVLISNAQEDLWSVPLTAPQACSPQVVEMLRFDKSVSCLSSGKIDLHIPVLDFQDPDFDLSMSLSYNSEGFKPSEPDNIVGRNWSLITGGVIYREVKGIPDDIAVENGEIQSHPLLKGFLFHSGSNISNDDFVTTLEEQPENCYGVLLMESHRYLLQTATLFLRLPERASKLPRISIIIVSESTRDNLSSISTGASAYWLTTVGM